MVARIFPQTLSDRFFLGVTADLWMEPGVTVADLPQTQAVVYQDKHHAGKVALVLGAGNVASIAPLDVLYKLFVEDQVVVLKANPVNAYQGPLLEEAFWATLVMTGVITVNATVLPHTPLCFTCALPLVAPDATVATICVLLQLTMLPASLLLSHTLPVPCTAPNPLPVSVTCVPGTPLVGFRHVFARRGHANAARVAECHSRRGGRRRSVCCARQRRSSMRPVRWLSSCQGSCVAFAAIHANGACARPCRSASASRRSRRTTSARW